MSPEQENFEALRRLLALKRYEQPHPGYFDDLSRRVLLRIKTGDRGEEQDVFGRVLSEAPWLQRFLSALATNPALAGAFGVAVCSLLIGGVAYSSSSAGSQSAPVGQVLPPEADINLQLANQSSGFVSSTNGFAPEQPRTSLFDEFHAAQPQPVLVNTLGH